MEVFNGLCPEKKAVTCLEDLVFTVKEFKEILKGYKEKTSGCKSDLMLRGYTILSYLFKSTLTRNLPEIH